MIQPPARWRRSALLSIAAAALLALGAGPAFASSADRSGTDLTYTAGAEVNDVTVSRVGGSYRIDDPGVAITPGAGCTAVDADTVDCDAAPVAKITLNLGDGNDKANLDATTSQTSTLNGGLGDDTLSATSGPQVFNGGAGADTVSYSSRTVGVTVTIDGTANDGQSGENDNVATDVETVTGGSGADTLTGGSGNDTLNGADGDDVLAGGAGTNVLNGGNGNDTLNPGSDNLGSDTLNGDDGFDGVSYASRSGSVTVTVGNNADQDGAAGENDKVGGTVESVTGGSAGDTITGDADGELLAGGPGADTLNGGDGNDTFAEGAAANGGDAFNGGNGTDTVDYSARVVALTITMGAGANDGDPAALPLGENDDVKADVEIVNGGSAGDTLTSGSGSETLNGGGGNDTFAEGSAANGGDTFNGGAGSDTLSYANRTNTVIVTMGDGTANDGESGEGDNVGADIETLTGGLGADQLTGTASGETLNGGAAADTLSGAGGNDTLNGGNGNDILNGGDGDDALNGEAHQDTLNGEAGNDTISGGTENDALSGGTGDDRFNEGSAKSGDDVMLGGDGTDTADYSARTAAITVTIDGVQNDGDRSAPAESDNVAGDVENVAGGSAADTITGSDAANRLTGNGGADTLSGGAGDDTFDEGAAANGGDVLNGGDGIDTADYSARTAALTITVGTGANDGDPGSALPADDENDNVGADVETVIGGSAADEITGDASAETLDGRAGNDTLNGGDGADTLNGGDGADAVNGQGGGDVLHGDAGDDTVDGGAGDDGIFGDAGLDTLLGGDGNDLIVARDGQVDTVTCGAGTDGVTADPQDRVALDCEVVDRGAGVGAPAPGPGAGPGPTGADTRAPRVTLTAPSRQRLALLLRRGLTIRVKCNEACSIRSELRVDRRTAKRLGLGRTTLVGRATGSLGKAGTKRLTISLSPKAKRALRKVRALRLTLRVRAADRAGNARTLTRRIAMRR